MRQLSDIASAYNVVHRLFRSLAHTHKAETSANHENVDPFSIDATHNIHCIFCVLTLTRGINAAHEHKVRVCVWLRMLSTRQREWNSPPLVARLLL